MKDKSKELTLHRNYYFDKESEDCLIQSVWMGQLWSEFADKDRLKKEIAWELKGKTFQEIDSHKKKYDHGLKSEWEELLSFPEHRAYFDDPLKEEAFCFFISETGIDSSQEKYKAPFWGEKYSENKNSFLVHSRYFYSLHLCYKYFFEIEQAVEKEFEVGAEECFLLLQRINIDLWYTMGDLLAYWHIDDRRKRFSKKGGHGHGKNPAVYEAIKYALIKAKDKTAPVLWQYLKGHFRREKPFETKDSDIFFDITDGEIENTMKIEKFTRRGKTKINKVIQPMKFTTFKTYVSDFKKKDR